MKKGDLKILGNYELGYFIYEIGKPNPQYKVIGNSIQDFNIQFIVYNMKGDRIGDYTSLDNLIGNMEAYHNYKPAN